MTIAPGAAEALQASLLRTLQGIGGLGAFDGAPVQAAFPFALIEPGFESDWGHKSGEGREVRIAISVRDQGERPMRLQRLLRMAASRVNSALTVEGWQLVTFVTLGSRIVRDRDATAKAGAGAVQIWAGIIEFRARMLARAAVAESG